MTKLKVCIGFPLKNVIVLFYLVSIKLSLKYDLSATQLRMLPLFAFTYNLSLKSFAFP